MNTRRSSWCSGYSQVNPIPPDSCMHSSTAAVAFARDERVGHRGQCDHVRVVLGRHGTRGLHDGSARLRLEDQQLNQPVLHRLETRDRRTEGDAILEVCGQALQRSPTVRRASPR